MDFLELKNYKIFRICGKIQIFHTKQLTLADLGGSLWVHSQFPYFEVPVYNFRAQQCILGLNDEL